MGGGGLSLGPWPVRVHHGTGCTLTGSSPQLPLSLCKKVLVIMHDSILPHLAQPSLTLDFLTRAYDMGERGTP